MENGNNNNNISFDNMWTLNHSRFDWGNSNSSLYATATTTTADTTSTTCTPTTIHLEASADPALAMFPHSLNHHHWSLYAGDGSNVHPDPHLTRLKLGKRHYFEDYSAPINGVSIGVGLSSSSSAVLGTPASVPRCQVEDCHVALINAKDYHRRHKVCEMHSKAPKAVVLGLEQRFCQQGSRFHVVSEFDGMKRSCRRRLAGHNKRRRKSYQDYISTNSSQVDKLPPGRFPYIASPIAIGSALSLLS